MNAVRPRGLGARAARGVAITALGQGCRLLVQFLSIVILARLLEPADYGLVAMATAAVGLANVLLDFGLSAAAVQAKILTPAQESNLFWLNTAAGLALATLVLIAARPIASIYSEPLVSNIVMALSVTFLMAGLTVQHRARLIRRLRFIALSVVDVLSAAIGLCLAILLGVQGLGYWALVVQALAQSATTMLATLSLERWKPGLPARGSNMRPLLKFSLSLTATQTLGYVSRRVDSLVIGSRFGANELGFYNRAFQLLTLPLSQIQAPATNVALPVLSRLQDEPQSYNRYLLHAQTVLLHVVVGALALGAAQAPPLVRIVLGPDWARVVPIFQVLAIGGAFQAAGYAAYWVFLSRQLTAANFRYALVARPIVISLVLVGAFFGPLAVAAGYSAGLAVIWPLSLWWVSKVCDAPANAMFRNGIRILSLHALAGGVSWSTCLVLRLSVTYELCIGILAFVSTLVVVGGLSATVRGDARRLLETVRLVKD